MRRYQLVTLSLTTLSCGVAIFTVLLRKKRKKKGSVGEENILSQLPDEVAALIMARLPAKAMGTMSAVSKRCMHLCKLVTHVKFCCFDLLRFQEYGHWYELPIYRLLRCFNLRYSQDYAHHKLDDHRRHCYELLIHRLITILKSRQGYKIESLRLDCCIPNQSDFKKCLYHLQHSGVEALYLQSACRNEQTHKPLCFPINHLHLLPSLNLLRLSLCILKPELGFKSHSLQTLELKTVKIFPAALECILSGCLRLISLSIHECECPSRISISGPDLPLKSLDIEYSRGIEEIELHASNLIDLNFKSHIMVNFIFDHVPQLQTLYFSVQTPYFGVRERNSSTPRVIGAFDNDLSNLRSLTLVTTGSFYQESRKLMKLGVGMFMELRELKLYVCCMPKINLVSLMIQILQSCPLLREFTLDLQNLSYEEEGEGPVMRSTFSQPSLKKVWLSAFSGKEHEIELALCILRSAVRLDEMLIMWSPNFRKTCCRSIMFDEDRKKWNEKSILQKIQGRAISKNAKVYIENVHVSPFKFILC